MNNNNEYSIYNYLKEHPGLLVSLASAATLIFAFLFNLVLYLITSRYLNYWGITETSIIEINLIQKSFMVAICVMLMVILILQKVISDAFFKYLKKMEVFYAEKYYEKKLKRRLCKTRRKIKKEKKKLKKVKDINVEEEQKRFVNSEEQLSSIQNDLEMIRKSRRVVQWHFWKQIAIPFIVVGLLIFSFVYCVIFILFGSMVYQNMFLIAAAFTIYFVLLLQALQYVMMRLLFWKKVSLYYSKGILVEKLEAEYAVKSILDDDINQYFGFSIKEYFSNKHLASFTTQIVLWGIISFITFSLAITSAIKDTKDYRIVSHEEKTHAIIYENSSYYYIEEAEIKGKTITIDSSIVKVIPKENVYYENKSFDSVNRLEK